MKKEERNILTINKLHSGEDIKQALREIDRLENSQIQFKNYKREISKLKKIILQMKKNNDELINKNFKLNLKVRGNQEVKRETLKENGEGQLKICSRILSILKEAKEPINQSEVCKSCLSVGKIIYPCLGFLEKTGLVKSEKVKGAVKYWIEK